MKNYKIFIDGICSSIELTDDEPDNYEVFRTFREAQRELKGDLERKSRELKETAKHIARLKKNNIK